MPAEASTSSTPVSRDAIARFVEQQDWISPDVEKSAQGVVNSAVDALGGDPLRNFLYGQWMDVPLHAVLTDVPIGSWTATLAFDAIGAISGNSRLDAAADATNMLGLAAASVTALVGLNDWSGIDKPAPRRIGLVHGLLNVAATGLFLSSCFARRSDNRSTGRALAALGYLVLTASAHLGGSLVYEHGIGVNLVDEAKSGNEG
jgi:uncharacterized membrane protein